MEAEEEEKEEPPCEPQSSFIQSLLSDESNEADDDQIGDDDDADEEEEDADGVKHTKGRGAEQASDCEGESEVEGDSSRSKKLFSDDDGEEASADTMAQIALLEARHKRSGDSSRSLR